MVWCGLAPDRKAPAKTWRPGTEAQNTCEFASWLLVINAAHNHTIRRGLVGFGVGDIYWTWFTNPLRSSMLLSVGRGLASSFSGVSLMVIHSGPDWRGILHWGSRAWHCRQARHRGCGLGPGQIQANPLPIVSKGSGPFQWSDWVLP